MQCEVAVFSLILSRWRDARASGGEGSFQQSASRNFGKSFRFRIVVCQIASSYPEKDYFSDYASTAGQCHCHIL
jgi:hypothetical protein